MIQNYAVENSVNVGGKRFLFCISTDENEPHPYMKCRERRETFLAHYENAIAGNDYLEVMKLYVKDISDAIAELENERIALGVENADCLKPEELIPIGEDDDIRGKVVALHERELICLSNTRMLEKELREQFGLRLVMSSIRLSEGGNQGTVRFSRSSLRDKDNHLK